VGRRGGGGGDGGDGGGEGGGGGDGDSGGGEGRLGGGGVAAKQSHVASCGQAERHCECHWWWRKHWLEPQHAFPPVQSPQTSTQSTEGGGEEEGKGGGEEEGKGDDA